MSAETDLTKLSTEELIKLVEEKNKVIEGKESELSSYDEVVAELKEELSKKESDVSTIGGSPTVTSGKETYLIAIHEFRYENEIYTTADLLKNDKLVADLIELGSGVLVKIDKPKKK